MRLVKPFVLTILCICLATAAMAAEVIHFTNGTTITARSHKIEQGMIHVTLETDAVIAFPSVMVEKVTVDGREVDLGSYTPNVALPGERGSGAGRARPVSGVGGVPSQVRQSSRRDGVSPVEREAVLQDAMNYRAVGNPGQVQLTRPVGPGAMSKLRETIMPGDQQVAMTGGRSAPMGRTFAGKKVALPGEAPRGMQPGKAGGPVMPQLRPEVRSAGQPIGYQGDGQKQDTAPYQPPPVQSEGSGDSDD
jgi:hypothetical protein